MQEKIKTIKNNIPNHTIIIAASKRANCEQMLEAAQYGIKDFGENFLQPALVKINQLQQYNFNWHFIGKIQTNKIKQIAKHFHWVHSAANLEQVITLEQINPKINICMQVKLNNLENRTGCLLTELPNTLEHLATRNIFIRGLMYLPPAKLSTQELTTNYLVINQYFCQLQSIYKLDTLSMGMSQDYILATAFGANMIRIGSNIFSNDN